MKTKTKKRITFEELAKIPEHRNRVFELCYNEVYGLPINYFKYFQRKENLMKYVDNPKLHIKGIAVCDVYDESENKI